jgi:regulator of RNase E activity RraB
MIAHYFQHHDNEPPVRVDIDLSLAEEAPQFERPQLLWVFVKMKNPDASGLCSGDECGVLEQMREALSASLETELKARFSGSRMCEGWFELYFYARSAKRLIDAAGKAISVFEGYTFDTGSSRDEEWEHYSGELYPDALMLHQIQSRQIIEELVAEGDDITIERDVEHYLLFQLPTQAERAVGKLEESGYTLKESFEQDGEYPYGRVMVKNQSVTEDAMEGSAAELLDVVYEEHGLYEGWSTTLAEA